jgi:hypothetical protein
LTRQGSGDGCDREGPSHWPATTPSAGSSGVWIGPGLAGIDSLQVDDPVTAEQMQALFGVGLHPLTRSGSSSCKALI